MSVSNRNDRLTLDFMASYATMGLIGVVLIGQVVPADADEPRANRQMKVVAVGPDKKPLPKTRIHAAIWAKSPAKTNRDYVCDERGEVLVDLPAEIGILRLWAKSDGHVALFAQWSPQFVKENVIADEEPIPETFVFELEKGVRIGGIIVNDNGKPIPGVKVQVLLDLPPVGPTQRLSPNSLVASESDGPITNAEGRWSLNTVPDHVPSVYFQLNHPDYLSDYSWRKLPGNAATVMETLRRRNARLVMGPGITVTGTITGTDGKGIANAIVIWGDDPYLQNARPKA